MFTESSPDDHDAGESNPSSEVSSGGQSGRLDARSSTILIWSPSITATFTNFPDSSPRWCFTTSSPGAATSTTKQRNGMARTVPQTARPDGPCETPR